MMNRQGDQGLLVVGLLVFLLICAVVGVALQGQQLAAVNADLNTAQVTLTAVADAQGAVATAAAVTLRAAEESAARAVTAGAATQSAQQQQQREQMAEMTAQVDSLAATQTQAVSDLQAAATRIADDFRATENAAFQEGILAANGTSVPAFNAFSTAVAITQTAQADTANATVNALATGLAEARAEAASLADVRQTAQAQAVIVATYQAVSEAFAATRQAVIAVTVTLKAPSATPDGAGLPVAVGDLLLEDTFSQDEAPVTIGAEDGTVRSQGGQHILVVNIANLGITSPRALLADDRIYAEVLADISACTPDGYFGLALTNSDATASYEVQVECSLAGWRIVWYDAADTLAPTTVIAQGALPATGAPPQPAQRVGLLWQDNTLTLFVNGGRAGGLRDTRLGEGYIALYAGTAGAPSSTVRFDDLRVWALR